MGNFAELKEILANILSSWQPLIREKGGYNMVKSSVSMVGRGGERRRGEGRGEEERGGEGSGAEGRGSGAYKEAGRSV